MYVIGLDKSAENGIWYKKGWIGGLGMIFFSFFVFFSTSNESVFVAVLVLSTIDQSFYAKSSDEVG